MKTTKNQLEKAFDSACQELAKRRVVDDPNICPDDTPCPEFQHCNECFMEYFLQKAKEDSNEDNKKPIRKGS